MRSELDGEIADERLERRLGAAERGIGVVDAARPRLEIATIAPPPFSRMDADAPLASISSAREWAAIVWSHSSAVSWSSVPNVPFAALHTRWRSGPRASTAPSTSARFASASLASACITNVRRPMPRIAFAVSSAASRFST